jgi:SPP1 gp7 family putative phage head morphogenesis protein
MADKAHRKTDKLLAKLEEKLEIIYKQAGEDVEAKAAEYFKKFATADAKKAALVAEGKLDRDEYIRWRKNKLLYGEHWKRLKSDLALEYLRANETALSYVNGKIPEVYAINRNFAAVDISEQVSEMGGNYAFELVDAQTVKKLAMSDETLLPYKYVDGVRDVRWNTQKVNSAVLGGILAGDSVPKLARRLRTVTGMNRTSAIRNARTTVTSAENKGRQDSYEQAEADGIKLRREWIAAIDSRTRHAHRLLDGQLADTDKPFKSELGNIMYPGDPKADPANVYNCRCTVAATVVSIDGVDVDDEEYGEREYADRRTAKDFYNEDPTVKKSDPETPRSIGSVDFSDTNAVINILEDAERKSKNLSYESCCVVTSDGRVWKVDGESSSVNPGSIPSSLIGSYSYHNHPANKTWYSFSANDVGVFFEHKQAFSKASDDIYEYIMRRTKDTIDLNHDSVYNVFREIEKNEVGKMKWEGIIDPDMDGYHSVMEILSKRYHFEYERKKINDQ